MSRITHKIKIGARWRDLPNWATWLAQDSSGWCFVFSKKPVRLNLVWMPRNDSEIRIIGPQIMSQENWKEEIYKIEREE